MKNSNLFILVLALANASVVVGMGLITPSITIIKADFNLTSDMVQLTLTVFIIAAGIGQLVFGFLSDRYGRRPILLTGSFLFFASSITSVFSPNILFLLIMRVIQGLGAAACMSMARVIINDSFNKTEAAEKLSLITAIMVIFPLISLILGGFIAQTIGWVGTMYVFFIFGLIILTGSVYNISETKITKINNLNFSKITNSFLDVLKNTKFLNFTFIGSIQTGVFFSSFGFMPYEFARLGVSPLEFGFWLSFTGIGYFLGNILNRNYASKYGIEALIIFGSFFSFLSYFSMLILNLNAFTHPLYISIPLIVFGLGNGFTVANCIIGGVSTTGNNSGTATGIAGALQMSSGGLIGSIIISYGGDKNFVICLLIVIFLCLVALILSLFNFKNRDVNV
ncbi:MAG: Bcr/CflA family drug resistance efflux transporter [Alphaproteobacteria bacterium]|nr:MAG: Bcr/CflA family drug resistance efflux transporter [Alphaproteobacteria bacterium]